jgi:hypothetical protein
MATFPLLKPFRDYSEHEVINLFALNRASGDRGQLVKMVNFDPDNHSNFGASLPGVPSYAFSADYFVNARVDLAASGNTSGILGLLLYDVRQNLPYLNTPANLADPIRLAEQQVVPTGRAVPILTRGIVEIGGFEGTPAPGMGAYVGNTTAGAIRAGAPGSAGQIGTFLSSSGVDGYAILKLTTL